MSRNLPPIAEKDLYKLKKRIEHTWGRRLLISADCEKLQQHICQVTGSSVSANTLRRIFGFLETAGGPSLHTKNLLAQYCGFTGWEQLVQGEAGSDPDAGTSADELLFYLDFFKIEVRSEHDINYHNACRSISKRILGSEMRFNRLAGPLAENKTAQVFFYERFPWLDGLAKPYYTRGIQFYLQHKKSPDAQLFGNCLLFLSALLSGDQHKAKAFYMLIEDSACLPSFHDFLKARKLGSMILYKKWVSKEDYTPELNQVRHLARLQEKPAHTGFWRFPYFSFMMADYLNLAGLYAESAALVSGLQPLLPSEYVIEQGYPEAWQVIRNIARHEQDPQGFCRWFENFEGWEQLDFLFRKFYRLQALHVYCALAAARQVKKLLAEKEALIASTGFCFFQRAVADSPS